MLRERERERERERDREREREDCDTSPVIDIFRALLLHAFFMGDWYSASFSTWGPLSLASAQNDAMCLLCWLQLTTGFENFHHYIYFWCPHIFSHTIHVAFFLSLVYLKTQLHIVFFEIHTTQPVKGQYVILWTTNICIVLSTYYYQLVIVINLLLSGGNCWGTYCY